MHYALLNTMREIIIVGHTSRTDPNFSLNDLPGSGGRIDILCRCVNSALFLSHDLRRDVDIYLILQGPPRPPVTVKFSGEKVRYLNPDERSSGSLIKKALEVNPGPRWRESTPGVCARQGGLDELLQDLMSGENKSLFYLREDGTDIRDAFVNTVPDNVVFLLGDHMGMTPEEEAILMNAGAGILHVGPLSLHADHCIILVNNEMDRAAHR